MKKLWIFQNSRLVRFGKQTIKAVSQYDINTSPVASR